MKPTETDTDVARGSEALDGAATPKQRAANARRKKSAAAKKRSTGATERVTSSAKTTGANSEGAADSTPVSGNVSHRTSMPSLPPRSAAGATSNGSGESNGRARLGLDSTRSSEPLSGWDERRVAIADTLIEDPMASVAPAVAPAGAAVPVPAPLTAPAPVPGIRRRELAGLLARHKLAFALGCVLLLSALAHGIDLLHYPYVQQDEGTYFSDAWAVFHLGRLAPYTYFYDHAPLGWIQIGVWQLLTSWTSFGYGIASGRVLMIGFQLASALLVALIARRATGRLWVGVFAALLMSLEPYSIQYQRQILLDNVAVFWLLLSVYFVMGPITLRRVWLSAAAIGIAILSKEVAVAALPVLAVFVWRRAPRENRILAIGSFLSISLGVCSLYAAMALLKGELFSSGSLLGGTRAHVSLLCSIAWQASRGEGSLLHTHSQFWQQMGGWLLGAPLLVVGGTAAAVGLAIAGRKRFELPALIGWITLALWLFIGRNGVVASYYLLPLVPFLAIAVAIATHALWRTLQGRGPTWAGVGVATFAVALLGSSTVAFAHVGSALWTGDQVSGQLAAERWIETHIPSSDRMVIDMSMWQDLHVAPDGRSYRYAEYYWKAAEDPAIKGGVFGNNWRNVDYVVTTPELIQDTVTNGFPVVERALEHSLLVRSFVNGGWVIEIRRVVPRSRHVLFSLPRSAVGVSGSTTTPNGCMAYGSH